ncbi:2-oxo acid dehydrogenase subunit E2 [Litorilinea aerophila]|uniref:Dihydrolipoamide acetyltransferase component of pyruvate dehydrogenase complex n=1 Tax=Litorilinea aerophila TaxID=1204385 RepID=A0A540VE61_9CHLR|nr:dihydrolipoamide acetyltransferase family protein [Litorilinea aerophila]MCC9077301.1 2-oxo acid dehydrogenase subunit E2 [Litorilinea aerophila]OUC07197.1 dehydrogenase [Litorilinea aerophila]GIV79453.1 MAG: dihydrolipoamide acetyltransferase component of pyruvate dehydrogenase complex [Litorilinea sp.]
MPTPVKMPQLGESVVEGTVARWLKAPGEPVARLEPLLEITTDKIDTEVPAPAEGVLLAVQVPAGQTVAAGTILGYIGAPDEKVPEQAAGDPARPEPSASVEVASSPGDAPPGRPAEKPSGRAFISPVVARMADEHGLDLAEIPGSGLGGRITKQDVLRFLAARRAAAPVSPAMPAGPSPLPPQADEVLMPLTAMRRAIARHMVQSKQTSPHVTTIFEADMTAVVRHREAHRAQYAARGLRLTFTPYFVAAAARALKAVPEVNARFQEGDPGGIILCRRVHIGVAVALDDGLIVPVIRDADEKSLQGLARAVAELADQARAGTLPPDATRGGTFTITNHGVSGSLIGTPIINQPQAGILGIGAIVKRPVVRSGNDSLLPSADDAIVIRPMCYLSFTFDHRILDGAQADRFVAIIKETLEEWPLELA